MPITVTYTVAYAIASDLKSGQLTITDTTDYAGQGITASNVEFAWGFSHVNSGTYRSVVLGQPQNILHSPRPQCYGAVAYGYERGCHYRGL